MDFRRGSTLGVTSQMVTAVIVVGHDGHISCLCACDMPSAIKDLVLQGAKDHACKKACHAYADLDEQDSNDSNGLQGIHANTLHAPQIL